LVEGINELYLDDVGLDGVVDGLHAEAVRPVLTSQDQVVADIQDQLGLFLAGFADEVNQVFIKFDHLLRCTSIYL